MKSLYSWIWLPKNFERRKYATNNAIRVFKPPKINFAMKHYTDFIDW